MGRRDATTDAYLDTAGYANGSASEIERAAGLRASGAITDAEFQTLKTRALA
jgi:hypothetical protein